LTEIVAITNNGLADQMVSGKTPLAVLENMGIDEKAMSSLFLIHQTRI